MKNLKLGVVGGGTVGRATARAFVEHVAEVRTWKVLECDLIMVCLPTPQKKDSLECDLTAIEDFFGAHGREQPTRNYVLRSTVPIGTTRRLREQYGLVNLVHSPEFLTSRCAVTDAQMPSRNIIGGYYEGPDKDNRYSISKPGESLKQVYLTRFPGVPVFGMTSDESEAVKLFTNAAFAVKVSLFNEFRCLADKLGLGWDTVLKGILSDGRVGHSHTSVPGPDGKRGFAIGSGCLEKDLANLINCMATSINQGAAVDSICLAAHDRNVNDRGREP